MVWIHGGGFKFGDSSEMLYGPDYLLAKDIVFVSFNYRLGVLGKYTIVLTNSHANSSFRIFEHRRSNCPSSWQCWIEGSIDGITMGTGKHS